MPFPREIAFMFQPAQVFRLTKGDTRWYNLCELSKYFGLSSVTYLRKKLEQKDSRYFEHMTAGGPQQMLFIRESAAYRLVLTSKRASRPGTRANTFLVWVSQHLAEFAKGS